MEGQEGDALRPGIPGIDLRFKGDPAQERAQIVVVTPGERFQELQGLIEAPVAIRIVLVLAQALPGGDEPRGDVPLSPC